MATTRTIWQILADMLAVRQPTRLVIDGVLVIAVSIVINRVDRGVLRTMPQPEDMSLSGQFFTFENLLSTMSSILWYCGIALLAVGCARSVGVDAERSGSGSGGEQG